MLITHICNINIIFNVYLEYLIKYIINNNIMYYLM